MDARSFHRASLGICIFGEEEGRVYLALCDTHVKLVPVGGAGREGMGSRKACMEARVRPVFRGCGQILYAGWVLRPTGGPRCQGYWYHIL